jgi:hypothetical protein
MKLDRNADVINKLDRSAAGASLARTFDRLLRLLNGHAERARAGLAASMPGDGETPVAPPTIARLGARLGLTPFEADVLTLCAALELDGRFRAACAAANGNAAMPFATFGLALNALPDGDWRAISASSALRYWRLVDVGPGPSLVESPLRIDDAVLQFVLGETVVDSRIADLMRAVVPLPLSDSQQSVALEIARAWIAASAPVLVALVGGESAAARAVAAEACALVQVPLRAISFSALLARGAGFELDVRLIARQMLLDDCALLIDQGEADRSESSTRTALERLIEPLRGEVFCVQREPLSIQARPALSFTVAKPTSVEQRALWNAELGDGHDELAARLATQFDFGTPSIELAARSAMPAGIVTDASAADRAAAVWSSARRVSRVQLDGLAQLVEPRVSWDALVLPEAQQALLSAIVDQVRHRATVYDAWGFGANDARGFGITALFAGPSGTGKTLAAEVIAGRLELDLYRVDLSAIVSKYIGETEKNLRRIFESAEQGGAILLFDEADALFGKRSEVKDSHDRYANVEVSYLLQRMETYRGVAILTTNMKDTLDKAFLRRIQFVVSFPFPDAALREAIWRGVFSAGTPLCGLDYGRLAQLDVAGANIRNIARNAAFLAAAEGTPVGMQHLLSAARIEYAKVERTPAPGEIAGWNAERMPARRVAVR